MGSDTGERPDANLKPTLLADSGPAPETAPAAPTRFGDYEVLRKIGEGGMGEVYEVFSERQQRRAAVKILGRELTQAPQFAERFLSEVRAANVVAHPGIITILHVDQLEGGRPYFVMEYLDGPTLRQRLRQGPMPIESVLRLGWQMALALAAAHDKGVVHRDLKPENVIVVPDLTVPGGERAKILDFGIAKLLGGAPADQNRTRAGVIMGTPAYMPPEQFRDTSRVDAKADVFALGVMLYELIRGEQPTTNPLPGPPCPPRLAQLVCRMQAPEATVRPTMWEVVAQLVDLGATGTPVGGWPRAGVLIGAGLGAAALLGGALLLLLRRPPSQKPPEDRPPESAAPPAKPANGASAKPKAPSAPAGMVAFAGGSYSMGSSRNEKDPLRAVRIRPFAIDGTEVPSSDFAAWLGAQKGLVLAGKDRLVKDGEGRLLADLYQPTSSIVHDKKRGYVVRPGLGGRPVVQVSWHAADGFCRSLGKRLPSENEWELAARGLEKSRDYPWGPEEPACDGVVFGRGKKGACAGSGAGPADVGTAAKDRTPEGVRDLGGNVAEWAVSASAVPGAGKQVVRGGDFSRPASATRAVSRSELEPDKALGNVGFRCAKTLKE